MAQAMPAPSTVKVYYGRPILPDVSRVLACLYEKEIDFELVDMYKGQRMPAEILKLQATMRAPVPAFEDSSKLLLESRAICRYVAEKYADQGNRYLLGRDLLERGSIEQWLKTEEQSFNPPSRTIVFHLAFNPLTYVNGQEQSLIAESGRTLARVLDVYEHRLGESKYLAGNEFTLADLSHLPNAHYLANSEEWRYLFTSRKNLHRWWEKISSRHAWEKVAGMLKEDASLKDTSTAPGDVATRQDKSPQQQSLDSSGSSIQLGRFPKSADAASFTASQPQQGDKKDVTDPDDAKSKSQPKETQQDPKGDSSSPNGQPTSDATLSNLGSDTSAPRPPPSQPQSDKTPQPQGVSKPPSDIATDPKTANTMPQPRETQQNPKGDSSSPNGQPTSDTTLSNLGSDTSAPRPPPSQPQSDKTPQPQGVSKPPSDIATDPKTANTMPQPRETQQDLKSDSSSPIGQPTSDTAQSNLGSDTSAQRESNKGAGSPTNQSNQQENLENPNSTASSATSSKPNTQSSGDTTA